MNNNINLIILGPPGSGKGTQAKELANKYNLIYFGTGDLMREEAEKKTEFGQIFQSVWNKGEGELVSEEIVLKFIEKKLNEIGLENNFIFDGSPRTIAQAELLDKIFPKKEFLIINIEVTDQALIKRMQTRRVCENCKKIFFRADLSGIKECDVCGGSLITRQEDQPEVIKKRLEVYNEKTEPVIEYYRKKGKIIDIDGEPPIEEVFKQIIKELDERNIN